LGISSPEEFLVKTRLTMLDGDGDTKGYSVCPSDTLVSHAYRVQDIKTLLHITIE